MNKVMELRQRLFNYIRDAPYSHRVDWAQAVYNWSFKDPKFDDDWAQANLEILERYEKNL